jgi:hypothetical protein
MTEKYTFDEWINNYNPVALVHSDFDEPYMFETYGEDREFLSMIQGTNVWTLIADGDKEFIQAGDHFVNRIGYFVTITPWDNPDIIVDWD